MRNTYNPLFDHKVGCKVKFWLRRAGEEARAGGEIFFNYQTPQRVQTAPNEQKTHHHVINNTPVTFEVNPRNKGQTSIRTEIP